MKKLSKLVALAASLVVVTAFSFIGCTNISSSDDDSPTVTNGYSSAKSTTSRKTLTLNVSSDSDLIDFSTSNIAESVARTITPAALDSSKVVFYLGGTDLVTGKAIDVQKVSFVGTTTGTGTSATTSKKEGTVTVNLEASNYRFTLVALLANTDVTAFTALSDYIGAAALIAYAQVDLRYTAESAAVNFVLTSDGLSGTSTIDLKLYLDNWSAESKALKQNDTDLVIAKAKVGLYDIETGTAVSSSEVDANFTSAVDAASALTYVGGEASANLKSGTYDLAVTFTLQNGKKFVYSDKIILLPNQKTEATIPIPEVLNLPPKAPSDLKIGYIVPTAKDSDYYKVVFNWKDNSKNEQYFELDLYDVSADTNVTADTKNLNKSGTGSPWTSSGATNTVTYKYDFYGLKAETGPSWYAGSLNRNNEAAVFYIPLGKRYLARIRAVNEAGASEYALTDIAATATPATDDDVYSVPAVTTYTIPQGSSTAESSYLSQAETPAAGTVIKFNSDLINLFRLKYELAGGAFVEGTGVKTVYYFDQRTAGNRIMIPDGLDTYKLATAEATVTNVDTSLYNDGAVLTLKYGTGEAAKKWTSWKISSISGKTYPSKYVQCTANTGYAAGTIYYTKGTDGDADINGDMSTYEVASTQPTQDSEVTASMYTINGLATYKGYQNLTLYASYTSNTFNVKIRNVEDYSIEQNLSITAKTTGEGTQTITGTEVLKAAMSSATTPAKEVTKLQYLTIDRTIDATKNPAWVANTLVFTHAYNSASGLVAAFDGTAGHTYAKIQVELIQQGSNSSVGIYTPSGFDTSIPLTGLNSGTYIAKFKAYTSSSNNKAPYEYSVYIQLND